MELIAVIIAALVGWQSGQFDARHLKGLAIAVLGWTAVTTVASLPYISVTGLLLVLAFRALVVGLPYAAGVGARRLRARRR
jgi:hypothetical protein